MYNIHAVWLPYLLGVQNASFEDKRKVAPIEPWKEITLTSSCLNWEKNGSFYRNFFTHCRNSLTICNPIQEHQLVSLNDIMNSAARMRKLPLNSFHLAKAAYSSTYHTCCIQVIQQGCSAMLCLTSCGWVVVAKKALNNQQTGTTSTYSHPKA